LQQFLSTEIEGSISARFEKMAAAHGSRLAIKSSYHTLTYNELNRRANIVAHAIIKRSRVRQQPIALLFESGADDIISLLAILKSGNCYVPLDPGYPAA
jgi:non-ribosomal peptide synthetase component F